MLNTALLFTVGGLVLGQSTYPDEADILRGPTTRPQIELVLDGSGSMEWSESVQGTSCNYYYANNWAANDLLIASCGGMPGCPPYVPWSGRTASNPAYPLASFEMLQASLTGCQNATDGVLDQWASTVNFAIRSFSGSSNTLLANFGSSQASLESAVLGMTFGGPTPMAQAYAAAADHMRNYFNNSNSLSCRQNYIVLMTDGEGNGGSATMSAGVGNASVNFNDVGSGMGTPYADVAARQIVWQDSNPTQYVDALPSVTGTQPIRTYTIEFGNMGGTASTVLSNMAYNGDGLPYKASSYQQLNNAFTQIILSIVARSNVSFSPGTVQNDGLFSGNYIYTSAFQPYQRGPWFGTTKKYCVIPPVPTDTTCLFVDDGLGNLLTNTQPQDKWTGTLSLSATQGGTGEKIWTNLFGVGSAGSPPPSNPLRRRKILTWRPGTSGYIAVDDTYPMADSLASTTCAHYSLLNKLHGFTPAVNDCANNDYSPVAFDAWPLGDTVHGDTVILKYTKNCENPAGDRCWVATVANDGMLHFYNGATGVETAAIIPGHLWSANDIGIHQLKDLADQPNLSEMRRFYFDGGVRLYHVDTNANGIIDTGETAKLIAGLGRGGRSYVLWDVSTFNGIPTTGQNPPQELMVDEDSPYRNLRETWAAPWIGRYRHSDGNLYDVAILPSGHDRDLDIPTANLGTLVPGLPPPGDTKTTSQNLGCSAFGLDPLLCNPPSPPISNSGCVPCTNLDPLTCPLGLFGVTGPTYYCYDWPGWAPLAPPPLNTFTNGYDVLLGPYSWSGGSAVAYRVVFAHFNLQPGDYISVLDSHQNEVGRLTGQQNGGTSPVSMPWVNDSSFYLRLVTDGVDDAPSTGFSVQRIEFVRRHGSALPSTTWRPSIFVQDLNRWNGPTGNSANNFPSRPAAGDTRQQSGLLLRITSDCEGLTGPNELCLDTNSFNADATPMADLAYMTCPISAEPSALVEGGLLTAIYWGDECGQIFRASRDSSGAWSTRRLLRTNQAQAGGAPIVAASKDLRRIFTRLELVLSTCNGGRAVGVYFGTGNVQRPAEVDEFTTTAPATFPGMQASTKPTDLMGVVWDHYALPQDAGPEDLENITSAVQVADPRSGPAVNGWIIELKADEKVLRDPVVLDGVAYFKTYKPVAAATECNPAVGLEYIYATNNCTGRPVADANGNGTAEVADRLVGGSVNDIGGDLLLFTPQKGEAFVTNANTAYQETAALPNRGKVRPVRFFLWRTTVDAL